MCYHEGRPICGGRCPSQIPACGSVLAVTRNAVPRSRSVFSVKKAESLSMNSNYKGCAYGGSSFSKCKGFLLLL